MFLRLQQLHVVVVHHTDHTLSRRGRVGFQAGAAPQGPLARVRDGKSEVQRLRADVDVYPTGDRPPGNIPDMHLDAE